MSDDDRLVYETEPAPSAVRLTITPATLLLALDARTGRTWHADDDGAHTTGWLWRLEHVAGRWDLTTGPLPVATLDDDPDPWALADAVADAITSHVSRVGHPEDAT